MAHRSFSIFAFISEV
uniref:Uncharacterized protein n=1 Tax=Anguilla anguilla TaxID=7936 RepID=A0A0E9Q5X0_ANGAN